MKSHATATPDPVPWKRVAVFVSSTFSDMHAERDYLVKRVFPDLHDWCERRRLRLVDVDLRWGVTEADATENRNVVQTCLKRIDECRPFFLCFVGQRRGWVPMPHEIHPRTLEAFPDLRQHIGKASVTELEIMHAILRPLHGDAPRDPTRDPVCYNPADHAFFYLRDPSYLGSLPVDPPEFITAYTNAGEADPTCRAHDDAELRRWREEEIPKCGRPVHQYSAQWNPALSTPELALPLVCPATAERGRERWRKRWARAGVGLAQDRLHVADENQAHDFNRKLTAGRLTEFRHEGRDLAEIILDDLKRGIAARYPDHVEVEGKPGSFQAELDQQEQFLFVNSEGFIERGNDFDDLDEYVRCDSRKLFVLTADGGMGKSMLLANWIDRSRSEGSPFAGIPFLFRFVGQSDGATTASNVQASILAELREVHGRLPDTVRVKQERQGGPAGAATESIEREVPLDIPGDPNKLLEFWREWLPKAATHGKCIIVIDALNQLEEGLEHLHWLPQGMLPEGLKFIVSFRRGAPGSEGLIETWRGSCYADKVELAEVRPFAEEKHRRALVDAYLDQYLKALDDHLIEELVSVEGAANPLFLKIVLSELRVFGSFEQLGQKIRSDFGTNPVSAFRAVLRRLVSDPAYAPLPSEQAVPVVFGSLACARGGLSKVELSDILCRALGLETPTEDELRQATEAVLIILRQERAFLARRDGRYDFFYESFLTAARDAFCVEPAETAVPNASEGPRQTEAHVRPPLVGEMEQQQSPEPSARPAKEWHSLIADHYWPLADPEQNGTWMSRSLRPLSEVVFHLIEGGREEDASSLLLDVHYLDARIVLGAYVRDLVHDYADLRKQDLTALSEWQRFLLRHATRLEEHRQSLFSLAYLDGGDCISAAVRTLGDSGSWGRPWIAASRIPVASNPGHAGSDEAQIPASAITDTPVCVGPAAAVAPELGLTFAATGNQSLLAIDMLGRHSPQTVACAIKQPRVVAIGSSEEIIGVVDRDGTAHVFRIHMNEGTGSIGLAPVAESVCYAPPFRPPPIVVADTLVVLRTGPDGTVSAIDCRTSPPGSCQLQEPGTLSPSDPAAIIVIENALIVLHDQQNGTGLVLYSLPDLKLCATLSVPSRFRLARPLRGRSFAVSFVDGTLRVYQADPELQEAACYTCETPVAEICQRTEPGIVVFDDTSGCLMVWRWKTPSSATPVRCNKRFPAPIGFVRRADGTYILMTRDGGLHFSLASRESEESMHEILAVDDAPKNCCVVLRERKTTALTTLSREWEVQVGDEKVLSTVVAHAGDSARFVLLHPSSKGLLVQNSYTPPITIHLPFDAQAAVGSPLAGFWIACRGTKLLRLSLDGHLHQHHLDGLLPAPAEWATVHADGDFITWCGRCIASIGNTATTEDSYVLLFFRWSTRDQQLHLVGNRTGMTRGAFLAGALLSAPTSRIHLLWTFPGSTRVSMGSTADYVSGAEAWAEISGIKGRVRGLFDAGDHKHVYVVGHDAVFLVDTRTWTSSATLPTDTAITAVCAGAQGRHIVVVRGRSEVLDCSCRTP